MTLFDSDDDLAVRSYVRARNPANAPALRESDVTRALCASPTGRIDLGHSKLAYYRFGSGPDLVFVHGWPLHAATFRRLVPLLAGSFTCHLLDLPGAGQTRCEAPDAIDLGRHTETLRRAVDHLGLRRYALIAHDSGGVPARMLAADDPRVTALVLGNTEIPGHRPWLIELFALVAKWPFARGLITRTLELRTLRHSPLAFGNLFQDRRCLDGDFHELFVAPLLASRRVADQTWRLLQQLDYGPIDRLDQVHARIKAPTLLIWGAADPFFPIDKARAMQAQFAGGAEWREIEHAKLLVHEERAEEFAGFVKPFLSSAFAAKAKAT